MMKKLEARNSMKCVKPRQVSELRRTTSKKVVFSLTMIARKKVKMMMKATKTRSIKTMTMMRKVTITSDMIWFVFKIIHLSNPLESATTSTVVLSEFTRTDVDSLTSR